MILVALTPLALHGVRYQPREKPALLPTSIIGLVFGLGGLVVPFIGIKLIDTVISSAALV